jgi:glycosyltransferase involved in cell wall biosynthesis
LSTRDSIYQEQLEGWIAREADLAWWFTQGALDTAIFRHRELRKNGICVLPGANPPLLNARYQRGTKLVIGHFGSLSKTRSLNRFVQGLQLAIEHCPELRNVFELHIYGGDLDELSKRDLDRYQLQDQVKIWGRLEFDEATQLTGREQVMQRMQQVDVLLMAHGEIDNCAEYIPSKLYEYFWANRPVFGLTHLNQQINDMILDRGGYCAPAIDTSQISNTLIQIYDDWIAALPKGPYGESSNSWHPKLPPVGVGEGISQILSAMRERGIHTVPSS